MILRQVTNKIIMYEFYKFNNKVYFFYLGSDTTYATVYRVGSQKTHVAYNSNNNQNDIAVVRVIGPIQYNPGVGPVCLPFGYKNQRNSSAK